MMKHRWIHAAIMFGVVLGMFIGSLLTILSMYEPLFAFGAPVIMMISIILTARANSQESP